jgi:hypothetical protein
MQAISRSSHRRKAKATANSPRSHRDWRIGLETAEDIDRYVADNPFPVLFGDRSDATTVTLASDEAMKPNLSRTLVENSRGTNGSWRGLRFETVQLTINFVCQNKKGDSN